MSLSTLAKTEISLPRLPKRPGRSSERTPRVSRRGRASEPGSIVGLDIGPAEVVAAQVQINGRIQVERAVTGQIDDGLVRDGEVVDSEALGAWLKDFFDEHDLPHSVRVGVTSPRAVMRIVDLPPLTDAADIAAAVRLHAPDHIAMPLDSALLDHQVVGRIETANGPRTRVIVVAAQRDAVTLLLDSLRNAGLQIEGVDLSAFALTRAMFDPARPDTSPVLYAHVSGVTTLAIARGATCELTRVSPIGIEQLAGRLAEREAISITEARRRLIDFKADGEIDERALAVLDTGLADLADDLSKTIEFHAAQSDGPAVVETVLSGPAALIPNFAQVLGERMGVPVASGAPAEVQAGAKGGVALERVALAAGLAVEEVAS